MGPLLKHRDCLKMQKTEDTELKATGFVPGKEKENEAKYSPCAATFLILFLRRLKLAFHFAHPCSWGPAFSWPQHSLRFRRQVAERYTTEAIAGHKSRMGE